MKALWLAAGVAFGFGSTAGNAAPDAAFAGYSVSDAAREQRIETQFNDLPSAQDMLDVATAVAARPHYAGTRGDYALALDMRDRLRAAGISTDLEAFSARVETPRELVLELAPPADLAAAPARGRHAAFPIGFDLAEYGDPADPPTGARSVGLPFNAGSADGDVSAPLVYADRGLDADYETLARAGVDVRGTVVLLRYGAEFRGRLAERAQNRGAAAVIFYSDPKDDGAARGLVDPNGPWRPAASIQRGWVGPAIRIPTLPVSATNAQRLLAALRGRPGPPSWGGALPVDYPLARGPGRVHVIVKLNRTTTTLWNTIGIIPGIHGDQSVIVGAHRDAWVYGVADNGSGVATTIEVARGLGFLVRGGWQPQRTIVIAGWDGEEIGLLGSRAYVHAHHGDVSRGCIAYLNADTTVTGSAFGATAAAALAPLVGAAARIVRDPSVPAANVYDRWAARAARGKPQPDAPGGGSDQESFLTEIGTPVAALTFAGPFGVDNSSYDTLRYATQFSDPDFTLHRAAAQLYGITVLRLADATAAPYSLSGYAALMRNAARVLADRNSHAATGADVGPLRRGIERFAAAAARFDASSAADRSTARALDAVQTIDLLLYGVNGTTTTNFPDLDAAVAAGDRSRVEAGVRTAWSALEHALADLGR